MSIDRTLAAVLRGEASAWADWRLEGATDEKLFERAAWHGVTALVAHQLATTPAGDGCPAPIRAEAERRGAKIAAQEGLVAHELRRVFSGFEDAHVRPILFKGTALAYSHYPQPSLRERSDTDLFVSLRDFTVVENTLASLGYERRLPLGDGATCKQAWFEKRDRFGLKHAVDVHWRISNRPLLMDLVSYDELAARAEPVPSLHPSAIVPCPLHALLLAAVHRVAHHDNATELAWLHDIARLASVLGADGLEEFRRLAEHRRVSAICANAMEVTAELLGTPVAPRDWLDDWRAGALRRREPSVIYLSHAPWLGDQAISDFLTQPDWPARFRYAAELVFPSARYLLARYGFESRAVVPFLHLWRLATGTFKLAGRVTRDLSSAATSMKVGHDDIV